MNIYGIDKETRNAEIEKVLNMEYRILGKNVLAEFVKYVNETNEQAFEEMLLGHRRNK